MKSKTIGYYSLGERYYESHHHAGAALEKDDMRNGIRGCPIFPFLMDKSFSPITEPGLLVLPSHLSGMKFFMWFQDEEGRFAFNELVVSIDRITQLKLTTERAFAEQAIFIKESELLSYETPRILYELYDLKNHLEQHPEEAPEILAILPRLIEEAEKEVLKDSILPCLLPEARIAEIEASATQQATERVVLLLEAEQEDGVSATAIQGAAVEQVAAVVQVDHEAREVHQHFIQETETSLASRQQTRKTIAEKQREILERVEKQRTQQELAKRERHRKSIEAIRAKYLEEVSTGARTYNNAQSQELLGALRHELARKTRLVPMGIRSAGGSHFATVMEADDGSHAVFGGLRQHEGQLGTRGSMKTTINKWVDMMLDRL